jgi:hypothetical protein
MSDFIVVPFFEDNKNYVIKLQKYKAPVGRGLRLSILQVENPESSRDSGVA